MTNTIDITQFREGKRDEAKLAKNGLTNSIWETLNNKNRVYKFYGLTEEEITIVEGK